MTEGEYRVGVDFNPGGNPQVDEVKRKAAELIDYVLEHGRDRRTAALAATEFETAAMYAVKSLTKRVEQAPAQLPT